MAEWKYPLFGCFSDCCTCFIAWLAPCILVGEVAETVGEDSTLHCCISFWLLFLLGLLPFAAHRCYIRGKLREQKGYEGSAVVDFLEVLFCQWCSLTQEIREIRGEQPFAQYMARE